MTILTNSFASKAVVALVAFAMMFSLALPAAQAQTVSELQSQINTLLAQIASLQAQLGGGGSTSTSGVCPYTWTRSLSQGASGADVMKLQQFLNSDADTRVAATGIGSAGQETQYYGALTAAAVSKFQSKYFTDVLAPLGLVNPTGYFGQSSITKANMLCSTASSGGDSGSGSGSTGSGALEGGAGSIADADFMSKLTNEEVGEDEKDVEVAGLELEADDGSDIELTAVNLNFDQVSAGSDFDKYAEDVSVWLDGEELARVDADEFKDDDNFNKTISLGTGGIIRAGDTGELVVAVSGISNLDSSDATDTWNVSFPNVRFRDAQGATVTDNSTGDIGETDDDTTTESDEVEFSFESFAAASDTELKVSEADDDINDGRTIEVDDTNDTDNVAILSFYVEVEGTSDLFIDDLSVDFTSGTAGVGEIINATELVVDGEVIGSESVSSTTSTTRTITYDNLDWTVDAGDKVEVIVYVDVNDIDGGFAAGDTLIADVNPDDAAWDVEDENGDDVAATDKSGTAANDAHTFYAEGIGVTFVSKSATKTFVADETGENDQVTFEFVFDVTAFGADMFIDKDTIATSAPVTSTDGNSFSTTSLSTTGTTTISSVTTADDTDSNDTSTQYIVDEGTTRRFTITIVSEAGIDGIIQQEITGIKWGDTGAGDSDADQVYTSNLTKFLSAAVSVNRD